MESPGQSQARPREGRPGGATGLGSGARVAATGNDARATVLSLLARHAEGTSAPNDLDRRLSQAMRGVPDSRQVASEIVAAHRAANRGGAQRGATVAPEAVTVERALDAFRRIAARHRPSGAMSRREPAETPLDTNRLAPKHRQSEPGDDEPQRGNDPRRSNDPRRGGRIRNISFASERLDTMAGPLARRVSFFQPDVLDYTGLYCREETDFDQGTASDEYYVVTSVVSGSGLNRAVQTVKHPSTRNHYTGVDTGDRRNGPIASCWSGAPTDLVLIATVLEQDSGDDRSPNRNRRWIDTIVRLALLVDNLGGESVTTGAPSLIQDLIDALEDVPETDDYIACVAVSLASAEVSDLAAAADQEAGPAHTPYDFVTNHNGDGARVRLYFRVAP